MRFFSWEVLAVFSTTFCAEARE